jgi:hypothetical protein
MLVLAVGVIAPACTVGTPTARAGTYTVLTCPGDDGWSQNTPSAQFVSYSDGCSGSAAGNLDLTLGPNPDGGYATSTGGAITFVVPTGLTINSYSMSLLAYGGPCTIVSAQCANGFGDVWVNHTGQADPNYDYRNLGYGSQTVTVAPGTMPSGVNWVTVGVGCDGGPGGYDCPGSQAGSPEASADIMSAQMVVNSSASPSASGFSGALLQASAHGTADLRFTADDTSGPGVYSVAVQIDGANVYNATPDGNVGECVVVGTYTNGSWEFEHLQPCKQEETVDVPVDTTSLADGPHTLKVTVTDAAQNASVVYDGPITTANRTTVSALLDSPLSASPSTEQSTYAIVLDKHTAALLKGIRRTFTASALTLSGQLLNAANSPAPGVTVSLVAQEGNLPNGTRDVLEHTTSDAAGDWVLHAPKGPSRLLSVVYGAAAQAASANAGVSIGEKVSPQLRLDVHSPGGTRLIFSGRLLIAPLGQPRPLVVIETRRGTAWQSVGIPVRVKADGSYRYTYESSPLTLGRRFTFRATTPETSLWQAATSQVSKAVVH